MEKVCEFGLPKTCMPNFGLSIYDSPNFGSGALFYDKLIFFNQIVTVIQIQVNQKLMVHWKNSSPNFLFENSTFTPLFQMAEKRNFFDNKREQEKFNFIYLYFTN